MDVTNVESLTFSFNRTTTTFINYNKKYHFFVVYRKQNTIPGLMISINGRTKTTRISIKNKFCRERSECLYICVNLER